MVPTDVPFIAENSDLEPKDMRRAAEIYRKIVEDEGHSFINMLDDPDLVPLMYHYDNLTVKGHEVMGTKLTTIMREKLGGGDGS